MEDDPKLHWFTFACNVSKHSAYRIKMGCVITKGNKPISVGFNKGKYNKIFSNPWRKSIHAEASAIKTSGRKFVKNATAYIYRETKHGAPAMARPCADCMKRLKDFGVRRIYYSISEQPYWQMEIV